MKLAKNERLTQTVFLTYQIVSVYIPGDTVHIPTLV